MRTAMLALLLVPALALGCAKDRDKASDSPDELELPPDNSVADNSSKSAAKPKHGKDDKVAAKKVAPAKPEVVHPKDRDQNLEKTKMKRSRDKSAKAKQLLRAGQNDQAITEARNALREHEQNVEAMLVIAEAFYKQGKHELVQSVTGSILKVDPKVLTPEEKSQAYNLMGFAYLQAGKRPDAFTAFKNAAETDQHNASAWNNLGVQYMWRGDSQTAEACFEYAVSLDAKFAEAQLNWGAALRSNGKLVEAESAFRAAAKLRPDWAEVHFNLGVLYLDAEQLPSFDELGKLNAAIAEFEQYKQLVNKGGSSLERSTSKKSRGSSDAMGNELVSIAQADLYIKAATKGIEAEQRRREREQKRKDREAEQAGQGSQTPEAAASEGDEAGQQPAPQKPGGEQPPAQPQKPGEQPQQPPANQPQQPPANQPQQPGQQPQKPGNQTQPAKPQQPQKPGGDKPAEAPPSEKPQAPAKPQQPQKPQPQKPKTQKPGS